MDQVLIGSRIINLNPEVLTNETSTYLSSIFVQETWANGKLTQKYYNSTDCKNILPETDQKYI